MEKFISDIIRTLGVLILFFPCTWGIEISWESAYRMVPAKEPRPYDQTLRKLSTTPLRDVAGARRILKKTAESLPMASRAAAPAPGKLKDLIEKTLRWKTLVNFLEKGKPKVEILDESFQDGVIYRTLRIEDQLVGTFQALFLLPGKIAKPFPAILGLHGHGGSPDSFSELLMGHSLAKIGFAVLLPQLRAMENRYEREIGRNLFLHGFHLMGLRIYEAALCLEILKSNPAIDTKRIGLLGHSGGSAIAHLLLKLRNEFKACVTDYDSSLHFPWEEFCCEAVPELAPFAHIINDRTLFSCKALKAPYHFSPNEKQILSFFKTSLSPSATNFSILKNQLEQEWRNLLEREIENQPFKKRQSTGKTTTPFDEWSAWKRKLSLLEYPSIADPFLERILHWEILTNRLKEARQSISFQRLPRMKLRSLSLLFPFFDQSTEFQTYLISAIQEEIEKFEDPRICREIFKENRLAGAAGRGLPLLLEIIETSPRAFFADRDFSGDRVQVYSKALSDLDFSKPSLQALSKTPVDFQLKVLLKCAEFTFEPSFRRQLRRDFHNLLQKNLKTLDKITLFVLRLGAHRVFSLSRDGPAARVQEHPLPSLNQATSEQILSIAREILASGNLSFFETLLAQVPSALKKQFLYHITLFAIENNQHPARILSIFSREISLWENPATRAGMREEVLREMAGGYSKHLILDWFERAFEDTSAIRAPFDREKHARSLLMLAADLGRFSLARKFLELVPFEKTAHLLKNEFNRLEKEFSDQPRGHFIPQTLKSISKEEVLKASQKDLRRAIFLFAHLHSRDQRALYPSLINQIRKQPANDKAHFLLDFAYHLLEMGNFMESGRIFREVNAMLVTESFKDFDELVRNCLKGLEHLFLYAEYRNLTNAYLKYLYDDPDPPSAQQKWNLLTRDLSKTPPISQELLQSIRFSP